MKYVKTRPHFRSFRHIRWTARLYHIVVAVLVAMILIVAVQLIFSGGSAKKYIDPENVATFRIPHGALIALWDLSQKYGIHYAELLTVYAIDNDFFPGRELSAPTLEELEKQYILNYDEVKARYPERIYGDYYRLIDDIFFETAVFPILAEASDSYMYGDSFGSEKYYGESGAYYGADILDRENVRGRISIICIADGAVETVGWSKSDGYHIGIRSASGIYYHYANLDSTPGFSKGDSLAAGQPIGAMGDSAYAKKEGAVSNHPIHLQIKIKAETPIKNGDFWFNPYPVLRLMEYKTQSAAPVVYRYSWIFSAV